MSSVVYAFACLRVFRWSLEATHAKRLHAQASVSRGSSGEAKGATRLGTKNVQARLGNTTRHVSTGTQERRLTSTEIKMKLPQFDSHIGDVLQSLVG